MSYYGGQTPGIDDNHNGVALNITGDPIRLTHSSTYSYYTSMDDALEDAESGDVVDVYDQYVDNYIGIDLPSGVTLKFNQNVELAFEAGYYIDVEGMLHIYDDTVFAAEDGCEWDGIEIGYSGRLTIGGSTTISSTEYGLKLYSSYITFPSSDIVEIENCDDAGVLVGYGSPIIKNVALDNCKIGVEIDNCDPSIENMFIDGGDTGIEISGSSSNPTIEYITIENADDFGIELNANVDLTLASSNVEDEYVAGSRVIFNSTGIGLDIANRLNNFSFDAGYDYYALDNLSNSVNVAGNWWGSDDDGDLNDIFSGYISGWPSRSHSHNDGSGAQMKIAAPQFVSNPFIYAQEVEFSGDFSSALDMYRDIIDTSDNLYYRRKAIKSIMRINEKNSFPHASLRNIIANELSLWNNLKTASPEDEWYHHSLEYLMRELDIREAMRLEGTERGQLLLQAADRFEQTSLKYTSGPMEVEMLARVANIYGDMLDDPATAKQYADRAAQINPGQPILRSAYRSANERYNPDDYEDIYAAQREQAKPITPFEPEPESAEESTEFVSVFPNPANPISNISYSIAEPSHVTLDIYSLSGQKVDTLVDDYRPAGAHSAVFDGAGMASGIYFYQFQSKSFSTTGKLLIMK